MSGDPTEAATSITPATSTEATTILPRAKRRRRRDRVDRGLPEIDHNGGTFVTWLAGAGVRGGSSHGQSDEFGYQGADGITYCYDLHATILHLLGIDHERLTVRHNGIDRRLTDVHGHVIQDILS